MASLLKVLSTDIEDVPAWMCAPIFRDAIVFYDINDQMVSVLNICFECEYIQNESGKYIDVDATVYDKLRAMLSDWGHKIEAKN